MLANLYMALVALAAAGMAFLVTGAAGAGGGRAGVLERSDWLLVAELFAIAVAAKQWPIEFARRRKIEASIGMYFLVALHEPAIAVPFAAAAELVGHVIMWFRGKRGWVSLVFNTSQQALAAGLAAVVLRLDANVLNVIAAGAAQYAASSVLVAVLVSLRHGRSFLEAWTQGRRGAILQAAAVLTTAGITHYTLQHPSHIPLLLAFPTVALYARWRGQVEAAAKGEALARLEAEQDKVRARQEFLGVASHELRTPLTTLKGHAYMLLRQAQRGAPSQERLLQSASLIDEQASGLVRLIEQLLDVTRIEEGKLTVAPQRGDFAAFIGHQVRLLRQGTGRTVRVIAPKSVPLSFDPLRMEQVLNNLVSNAIKFAPPEMPIDVRIDDAGDVCRLMVRDYGPGIPEDKLPRIFERYFQAHGGDVVGGLGIGLYVTKQLVELHGGSIHAANRPEGGAELTVLLPAPPAAESAPRPTGSLLGSVAQTPIAS